MDLNIKAEPFYPVGMKDKIIHSVRLAPILECIRKKFMLKENLENEKMFDILERMWWYQNKSMFEESFEDIDYLLKGQKLPYEELCGKRLVDYLLKGQELPYEEFRGKRIKGSFLQKVSLDSIQENSPTYADMLLKKK